MSLVTIPEASKWASEHLKKDVLPTNISYLVQYGKVKKHGENGSTMVDLNDLKKYYQSWQRKNLVKQKKNFSVVSLFAGCGGLDLGFKGGFEFLGKKYAKRSFEITWANDIDEAACETFSKNFKEEIVCGDISKILSGKYGRRMFDKELPQRADIVLGGFPCQDFSHAGKRKGFNSTRGLLYQSMAEVIKRTQPVLLIT